TCVGGPGLAVVLCTGAALRRPSACLPTLREEGCFSPAVGVEMSISTSGWSNPAGRRVRCRIRHLDPGGPVSLPRPRSGSSDTLRCKRGRPAERSGGPDRFAEPPPVEVSSEAATSEELPQVELASCEAPKRRREDPTRKGNKREVYLRVSSASSPLPGTPGR